MRVDETRSRVRWSCLTWLLSVAVVAPAIVATSTHALTLSVTDTTLLGPTSPIVYTLNVPSVSAGTATLTINTPADPGGREWYAGWFLFKFGTSTPARISGVSSPWAVTDGTANTNVKVLGAGGNFKTLRNSGFSGFYLANLAQGGAAEDPTQGIHLTGGVHAFSFTFNYSLAGGALSTLAMPFKAGYYDGIAGRSGHLIVNQLGTQLSAVPEPATVLLLGSSLTVVAAWCWVRRRNHGLSRM